MTARIGSLALAALLAATLAQAEGIFPPGSYEGTGHWTGPDGSTGQYRVETVVEGFKVTSRYDYENVEHGGKDGHVLAVVPRGESAFFDVVDRAGATVGTGYCYGSECSYRMEFDDVVVEEHLRFERGELVKLGSKSGPGWHVAWKETLGSK